MTAQFGENLILDGETVNMSFCPPLPADRSLLATAEITYVNRKGNDGREHHESYERWTDRDGNEHVEPGVPLVDSTACWRRYIGTWEIRDERFWLVRLRGRVHLAVEGPVLADWFTGTLRIPRGKMLHYVHMGFGSVFEEEVHIAIERGKVMGRRVLDNREQQHDPHQLGWDNLPGRENRFKGDRDFN